MSLPGPSILGSALIRTEAKCQSPFPAFYFTVIIINFIVIEIKFVLGVQLSLVVLSPVLFADCGPEWTGLALGYRVGEKDWAFSETCNPSSSSMSSS